MYAMANPAALMAQAQQFQQNGQVIELCEQAIQVCAHADGLLHYAQSLGYPVDPVGLQACDSALVNLETYFFGTCLPQLIAAGYI